MLVSNPGIEFKLSEKSLDKLWIPKFKFSYNFDVSETIKDLGIPLSLVSNPTDSSRMFDVRVGVPFIKHKIIQKACIEIDEKGTEAAAVTEDEEECGCSMYEPKRPSFVADHPFVFMIKEAKSGLGFFTGAVLDPTQSD
ncbi:hypothetical protein Vadar_004670 [Vaccinium darrowii]|uniref:Uncharacterized protein n=1 Tax=Vaccinium darrowii TaxID=229202 RepID=A0ACB7Y5M7_9ERIC|nr:hypothetical protein Vadar_004670 [Vaccinium darrowii]